MIIIPIFFESNSIVLFVQKAEVMAAKRSNANPNIPTSSKFVNDGDGLGLDRGQVWITITPRIPCRDILNRGLLPLHRKWDKDEHFLPETEMIRNKVHSTLNPIYLTLFWRHDT